MKKLQEILQKVKKKIYTVGMCLFSMLFILNDVLYALGGDEADVIGTINSIVNWMQGIALAIMSGYIIKAHLGYAAGEISSKELLNPYKAAGGVIVGVIIIRQLQKKFLGAA